MFANNAPKSWEMFKSSRESANPTIYVFKTNVSCVRFILNSCGWPWVPFNQGTSALGTFSLHPPHNMRPSIKVNRVNIYSSFKPKRMKHQTAFEATQQSCPEDCGDKKKSPPNLIPAMLVSNLALPFAPITLSQEIKPCSRLVSHRQRWKPHASNWNLMCIINHVIKVLSLKFFVTVETEAPFKSPASGFKEKYWAFFSCCILTKHKFCIY